VELKVKPDDVGAPGLLPITPELAPDELMRRLKINALAAHQRSMGHGDELVQILQRTVAQIERTHARVQRLSVVLFVTGIGVLVAGVVAVLTGKHDLWPALLGTTGGIAAFAAVFWTTPLDKVSASVNDLVKLETAFLGYIRVIGEIDSFFQMQYLDIIATGNGNARATLPQTIRDTTTQMREMMMTTVKLIDEHMSLPSTSITTYLKRLDDLDRRVTELAPK
jgi:hypothetical protein